MSLTHIFEIFVSKKTSKKKTVIDSRKRVLITFMLSKKIIFNNRKKSIGSFTIKKIAQF